MNKEIEKDHNEIREVLSYPDRLYKNLSFFDDTSSIVIPEDPVEKVIFQEHAKKQIRKIAQNKGHILMVGRPGTGKSLLANMFKEVLDKSMGDFIRPREMIVAYPGKDENHVRFAYGDPEILNSQIEQAKQAVEDARGNIPPFSLEEHTNALKRTRYILMFITLISLITGVFFQAAFVISGFCGIGSIFIYLQENNNKVQEKIQQETLTGKKNEIRHLKNMIPEILYDPTKDKSIMISVSEPDSKSMKGGFRHDPYQSGNLQTPIHKRTYIGAHAKAPVIYIDELKTLVNANYMSGLLEIMQNREYILEGGKGSGSGAADRAENTLKADNIIIACCNHDTLSYLQKEGEGAFLSRIEDKGEIIEMESSVSETPESVIQIAQYIKQEIISLNENYKNVWEGIIALEGHEGVKKRSELIFGQELPDGYKLETRDFSRNAVAEIVKELRCRASEGKLSTLLRPINGIIKTAENEAILSNSEFVSSEHVRSAIKNHISLEGALSKNLIEHKKDLKKYISSITDSIGYVVGLAVISSQSSGQLFGQPLPIHCQINAGKDSIAVSGKAGEIAKAAAQNVRASIKKTFQKTGAPYIGYEMHIEFIQAHSGVEGDSASIATDIGLISDYIKQPVNQKFGITGSLTGEIILAVGGVTEKIRSIMDTDLLMQGACIPWQNKNDIEPLLINTQNEFIVKDEIPGIRIYREENFKKPFDVFFIKTKYQAYKLLMGLDKHEIEKRMVERSKKDLAGL